MNKYYNVKNYARVPDTEQLPSLIEIQSSAFEWFIREGLLELFDEINPIESFNGNLKLYFPGKIPEAEQFGLKYWFEEPKYSQELCIERDMSYAAPLYVRVALVNREAGDEVVTQDIFLGDFPLMTDKGTFIINGSERVVVSQLIRSPGVYFDADEDRATGRLLSNAKLIPDRGAWMEFETKKNDYLTIKFNRKRTLPVTVLLRALAAVDDGLPEAMSPIKTGETDEILALFKDVDDDENHPHIESSIKNEPMWDLKKNQTVAEAALIEFYRKMRPGDPPTLDNAREYLISQLFDQRRYDLERVGRYKLNQRLGLDSTIPRSVRTVSKADIVAVVRRMIEINTGKASRDDIDHLGNRRVKTVGELIMNKLRVGLRRMERVVKERMSIREIDNMTPVSLVNIRPIVASVREFFGSSQLSQFMEQTNPLAELTHKRTLSALGPGGLRRERAGFDVRDVHHSHYGRICPIETPEGPNIGLIGRLASYARVNEYGFIETPYRKVVKFLAVDDAELLGRRVRDDVEDSNDKVIVAEDTVITEKEVQALKKANIERVPVVPFVVHDIEYLNADDEDHYIIAQANSLLNEDGEFISNRVSCRYRQGFRVVPVQQVDYIDIAPRQIVGISAALIPFLEHDDANRALMGSNMQRQAVPLLQPDVPIVSTGMEDKAAIDSGQVLLAEESGEVISVQGDRIIIRQDNGEERRYQLRKYNRSNQSTCIDQRPIVMKGTRVEKGDVLADSSSTYMGNLALGHDVLAAFICWDGGNYEDALLISEDMLRKDKFTSIHIEKHEVEARDTKLGPEEITYDIPNVGEDALKDLDEFGIVRVGAEVGPHDILVGKITPKGEKELSPEEKLLRAIFGEQAREVKDSSLRLPHGDSGKVVDVKTFTREEHPDLSAGVEKMVRVSIAQRRKLTVGDKMAGRHGNKGVISRVVKIEDMPYLEDGTAVEIILNPTGVPGRMNIGQVLELHLGWAADRLGFRAVTPVFDGADEPEIQADLGRAWMIDEAWRVITERAWEWINEYYDSEELQDDDEVRRYYIHAWLGENELYDPDALMQSQVYARRAVVTEWLREKGYDPENVLIFDNSTRVLVDREVVDQNAIDVSLRLWIEAYAPEPIDVPADADQRQLFDFANKVMFETGQPVPQYGKHKLYDGRSGELFDNHVAVGYVHMLKLAHLVEDKAHARSTGPYSLVTQQPLGGKAQFGGQRFGEMEVWALEAYGAAYTLQEMLTVKSDDVQGRVKTYESIVKGEPIEEPGIPTSFRVLVKELQSLGLAVEAITTSGDVIRFGKDEEQANKRSGENGLMGLARGASQSPEQRAAEAQNAELETGD
ncbi:DNA-directed RNA polymerase subunit beta [Phototrophicus methaneseepsis]|uniref:DNA-directed RNA polymerase subunit beta n=1 Tax=Phototrophicus methaneseepsis TaxID=2710758 RepID=A0A7S8ED51_9CHLR|nr:DNA-directed RNA polymerase subunit beta [Phototrophicus methaneseepsis]QPC84746.1 DNA-directed RNA polymerase subunit beta [Phototrophicus methaneseepsis]